MPIQRKRALATILPANNFQPVVDIAYPKPPLVSALGSLRKRFVRRNCLRSSFAAIMRFSKKTWTPSLIRSGGPQLSCCSCRPDPASLACSCHCSEHLRDKFGLRRDSSGPTRSVASSSRYRS